jgi:hypothetical protein
MSTHKKREMGTYHVHTIRRHSPVSLGIWAVSYEVANYRGSYLRFIRQPGRKVLFEAIHSWGVFFFFSTRRFSFVPPSFLLPFLVSTHTRSVPVP